MSAIAELSIRVAVRDGEEEGTAPDPCLSIVTAASCATVWGRDRCRIVRGRIELMAMSSWQFIVWSTNINRWKLRRLLLGKHDSSGLEDELGTWLPRETASHESQGVRQSRSARVWH